jgi:hypothetical protein
MSILYIYQRFGEGLQKYSVRGLLSQDTERPGLPNAAEGSLHERLFFWAALSLVGRALKWALVPTFWLYRMLVQVNRE